MNPAAHQMNLTQDMKKLTRDLVQISGNQASGAGYINYQNNSDPPHDKIFIKKNLNARTMRNTLQVGSKLQYIISYIFQHFEATIPHFYILFFLITLILVKLLTMVTFIYQVIIKASTLRATSHQLQLLRRMIMKTML